MYQDYVIRTVNSHVEVYDRQNHFLQSADSYGEAMEDMKNGEIRNDITRNKILYSN